nr:protein kinase [Magnetococcales bacterium]
MTPGSQIAGGAFTIERTVGQGPLGPVYLAQAREAAERVVLKALPGLFFAEDTPTFEQFQVLWERFSGLEHSRMARYLGHVADGASGCRYLIRSWEEGQTLVEFRKALPEGKVPAGPALKILRQIAEPLNHAHLAGFTHRNLSPGNVLRTPEGEIRLLDHGLIPELCALAWRHGVAEGEILASQESPYSCPEQFLLKHTQIGQPRQVALLVSHGGVRFLPGGAESGGDVFALAVLFYELVAGRLPFQLQDWETLSSTWWTGAAPEPEPLPELSESQNRVLARALNWDPRMRLASVLAFVNAMGSIEDQAPARPAVAAAPALPPAPASPAAPEPDEESMANPLAAPKPWSDAAGPPEAVPSEAPAKAPSTAPVTPSGPPVIPSGPPVISSGWRGGVQGIQNERPSGPDRAGGKSASARRGGRRWLLLGGLLAVGGGLTWFFLTGGAGLESPPAAVEGTESLLLVADEAVLSLEKGLDAGHAAVDAWRQILDEEPDQPEVLQGVESLTERLELMLAKVR